MTNVLVALKNLLDNPVSDLSAIYAEQLKDRESKNRANSVGDYLEYYSKDLFCNTFSEHDIDEKEKIYADYLSYGGNNSNPPDFIIKKGPAIEVKKLEGFGAVPLNSSYPKDLLHNDSTLISDDCRKCEDDIGGWQNKEMIYTIGTVKKGKLRVLWLLYGDCYAASNATYERIRSIIKDGVNEIQGVEFAETNELGKVMKIDPLGITDLRIRGMWDIVHPMKVFTGLTKEYKSSTDLQIYVLMLKKNYDKLPNEDKENLQKHIDSGLLEIKEVKIKNPNNTADYLDAIFFKASITKEE